MGPSGSYQNLGKPDGGGRGRIVVGDQVAKYLFGFRVTPAVQVSRTQPQPQCIGGGVVLQAFLCPSNGFSISCLRHQFAGKVQPPLFMIRVEACGLTEGTGGSFVLAQMRVCNSKQRPGLPAIGMGCQRSSAAVSFAGVSPEIFCAGQIEGGPPIIGMLSGKAFEQGLCLLRLMQAEIERPKAHRLCIIKGKGVNFVSDSKSVSIGLKCDISGCCVQQKAGVARPGNPRRPEITEGLDVVPLIEFNPAQIIVRKWVIRLDSQCLLKNPFGLV